MSSLRAYIHASEVLTGAGIRHKDGRRVTEEDLGRIPDGAVVYGDRIEWVGPTFELPKAYAKVPSIDLGGKRTIVPGFIDCHTHLVFAGDRSDEFAARCGGATYAEIAAKGGGIVATVRATRSASAEELERLAENRLRESFAFGVRTIEIKSGYGLSHESELKVLEVIARLRKCHPEIDIRSTYLGAHAFPPGAADDSRAREDYIREMIDRTLPEVSRRKLADSCDVFVDEGYYTVEEARLILTRARELGLQIKLHADEMANTECAAFAAETGALSADHLLKISDRGIERIAASDTVAVLLPATAFYLKAVHAPARKLLEAGAVVALATDFNPGTCMTLSMPVVMTTAALYLGMSRAEILAAVTYNAAKALGLEKRKGTLEPGLDAALTVLPFKRFEETYYRFAWSPSALMETALHDDAGSGE